MFFWLFGYGIIDRMRQVRSTPIIDPEKYKGSIVLTVNDKIYATKQPKKVPQMIKDIEKKYHKTPLVTVVPKDDTLIL